EDTRHGFTTFSAQVGREAAHWVYVMLILGAYVAVGLAVMVGALPTLALLTLFSLPLMAWILRDAERGAEGHLRAIAMIDLMTARLHSAFGVLLLVGLVAGSAVRSSASSPAPAWPRRSGHPPSAGRARSSGFG